MILFARRALSVLLLFLCLGSCWVVPTDSSSSIELLSLLGWNESSGALLVRRGVGECAGYPIEDPNVPECVSLCSFATCNPGPLAKRDLDKRSKGRLEKRDGALNETAYKTLLKRDFTEIRQTDLANYLVGQFENDLFDPYFGAPMSLYSPSENVVVQEVFGNTPFQVGIQGLCGCTAVTVVSERAVFMGHFYEDPTWVNPSSFKNAVLNFFRGANQVGLGPALNPALFTANDDTRVYIMTPRSRNVGSSTSQPWTRTNYYGKLAQLISTIQSRLGSSVPIAVWNYPRLDCTVIVNGEEQTNPALFESERGVGVFQYDPTGYNNARGWRLFYEQLLFRSTDPAPGPESARGVPPPP